VTNLRLCGDAVVSQGPMLDRETWAGEPVVTYFPVGGSGCWMRELSGKKGAFGLTESWGSYKRTTLPATAPTLPEEER